MSKDIFVSVGRRKTSVARVRLSKGTGKVIVNDKPFADYCKTEQINTLAMRPLAVSNMATSVDAQITVVGGGCFGQAGAISHGLARALEKMDPELRSVLKKAGLLTRDGRSKERKKSGQPGARRRFQFSKR